jgi:hypothetical protein
MNYSQKHGSLTDIGAEMSAIRRKPTVLMQKKKSGSKISFMNNDHRWLLRKVFRTLQ